MMKSLSIWAIFLLTLPVSLPLYLIWWSNFPWHSDPMSAKPDFFHNTKGIKSSGDHNEEKEEKNDDNVNDNDENKDEKENERDTSERVLVIGAGFSGLGMCSALRRHEIAFDCVERTGKVGGNWSHGVYETVHIISSKKTTEFKDWPMPEDYPDFPSAAQMERYLNDYADHWGFRNEIEFNTEVVSVQPVEHEKWKVMLRKYKSESVIGEEERIYGGICVCNGHHWDCRMPTYEGMDKFTGELIHSKAYKKPSQLKGKRVLVIGGGNSACDIAVEAARFADQSEISMRRGYHFLPRSILGIPLVEIVRPWFPMWLQRLVLSILVRIVVGDYSKYGLQQPDHAIFERHPTINSELVQFIKLGEITPRPDIARFDGGKTVVFTDGTRREYDLVVCCTGYYSSIPLLDKYIEKEPDTRYPRLISGMFVPGLKHVYNVGLGQVRYGAGPLLNIQAELISKLILAQKHLQHPIGDILHAYGTPYSGTSKNTTDELVDPHKSWKTGTIAIKVVVPLLPAMESLAMKLGWLSKAVFSKN